MAEFVPVGRKRQRLTFGRQDLVEIPDMIEVQRNPMIGFIRRIATRTQGSCKGWKNFFMKFFL